MGHGPEIRITSLSQLRVATSRGVLPTLRGGMAARVALPGATDADNTSWERRLRRHGGACGCEAGAVALVLAALAAVGAHFAAGVRLASGPLPNALAWAACAVGLSLLAKLAAIERSRWALRVVYREAEQRLGQVA